MLQFDNTCIHAVHKMGALLKSNKHLFL